MKPTTILALVVALLLAIGGAYLLLRPAPAGTGGETAPHAGPGDPAHGSYICPMHPTVRSDRPGACPICGMALVRRADDAASTDSAAHDLGAVALSPSQQVLANVTLVSARRAALVRSVRTVGTLQDAEPALGHVTLRFPGRIERLHVGFTGARVARGAAIADIYSPEAISAQREYLLALESVEATKEAYQGIAESAQALLGQARQKLERWGFTQEQIARLTESRTVSDTITVYSAVEGVVTKKYAELQQVLPAGAPLFDVAERSSLWLMADLYEVDLPLVKVGMSARASTEAYPGERFLGSVGFIDPAIDLAARTARARIPLSNADGRLKPGMFMQVELQVTLPSAIVVPLTAVLSTGQRTVVWVRREAGVFQPRHVTLGARSETEVQVLSGLSAGESVVVTGGYLLDSESQLQVVPVSEGSAE